MTSLAIKPNDPKTIIIALVIIAGLIFFLQPHNANSSPSATTTNTPAAPVAGDSMTDKATLAEKAAKYPTAPELVGISGYINAPAGFKLADVKGKVILLDFWTYSCINCQRTQPYLNAWQEKYADKGLVIVGVHTPEFDFEKVLENVQKAVEKEGIAYPVVLDNDMQTWGAYKNRYWPRKYLIDADGFVRYDHIGEGAYDETEQMIQQLLKERDDQLKLERIAATQITQQNSNQDLSQIGTPEIYLGYQFARAPLGNAEGFQPEQTIDYATVDATQLQPSVVYVEGKWKNNADHLELVGDTGKIFLKYKAKNLNIVAGQSPNVKSTLTLKLDSAALPAMDKGDDAILANDNASVSVGDKTLYHLVQAQNYDPHVIEIDASGKGFQLYTFTFG